MKKEELFNNFGSVMESEILDPTQMETLEGGAKCEGGCKKACLGGGQNSATRMNVPTIYDSNSSQHAEAREC